MQQLEPPDGGKTDTVQPDSFTLERERHVTPALHLRRDQRVRRGVVGLQEIECLVGKHHAEAESSIRRILFGDPDPGLRQCSLEQNPEIQTGRPGTNDFNLFQFDHELSRPRIGARVLNAQVTRFQFAIAGQ